MSRGRLGLPPIYDDPKVSRAEGGTRGLGGDDVVLWAALDPKDRGEHWIMTGLTKLPRLNRATGS